ncbi:chemotaxis protein CheW [bacterium]
MSTDKILERAQYLTFGLDEELYAFNISQVQTVLDFEKVTKVPKTPDFMRGVINLRGSVVPIVDLRLKFGMSKTEKTLDACIIIVEMMLDGEKTILGALADSVQEVIDLDPDTIEPAPKIGTRLNTEFIKGMGRQDENFIIILDLDRIFSATELFQVQSASDSGTPVNSDTDSAKPIKSKARSKKPVLKNEAVVA